MVSAQGITTGKASRPAVPGNRPLVEADPTMHDLVQQERSANPLEKMSGK